MANSRLGVYRVVVNRQFKRQRARDHRKGIRQTDRRVFFVNTLVSNSSIRRIIEGHA